MPILDENDIVQGIFAYCFDLTTAINKLSNLSGAELWANDDKLITNKANIGHKYKKIDITERQAECLFFLLRGKTAKEIAKFLNISPRTVEDYIEMLKLKFSCQTKNELVTAALERGLFNMIPKKILETQLLLAIC